MHTRSRARGATDGNSNNNDDANDNNNNNNNINNNNNNNVPNVVGDRVVFGALVFGGFDVDSQKFYLPCYNGGEEALLKLTDLLKPETFDKNRVTLPADLFSKIN